MKCVLLSSLDRLAQGGITAEQFRALDALRLEIAPPDGRRGPVWIVADRRTPRHLAVRARRRARLGDGPRARGRRRGHPLVRTGFAVLADASLEPGLEWVAGTLRCGPCSRS